MSMASSYRINTSDIERRMTSKLATSTFALCIVLSPVAAFAAESPTVTIDNSLTPAIAQEFAAAKTLAMPATIELDVRTADAFEKIGRYEVTLDRQLGAQGNVLLDSEKKSMLKRLCQSSGSDIALTISYVNTGNSGLGGALLGRIAINYNWTLSFVNCKSAAFDQFGGTYTMKQGLYSARGKSQIAVQMANDMVANLVSAFGR